MFLGHLEKRGQDVTENYKNIFEGIGCLPGPVDRKVQPVIHLPWNAPVKLRPLVKKNFRAWKLKESLSE